MNSNRITTATTRALLCAALLALAGLTNARAQGRPPQPPPPRPTTGARSSTMRVELPTPVAETPVPFEGGRGGSVQTLSFTTPDANFERNLVKDSPFTADSTTEHVQTLGDGNRVVRKSTAHLFRDSAGRTRREHLVTRGATRAPDGEEPRLIVINDPVGQVNYTIETWSGTARKMVLSPGLMEARRRAMGGEASFGVLMPTSTAHRRMAEGDNAPAQPAPKREKLEPQMIEGVMAEGTRITVTIPAGEFDNEQAMEITHEEWRSQELQMIVLMKHNDPRFGETVFRLTNISRVEPSPELFTLPQGYRIVDGRDSMSMPARRRPGSEQ
ncbi:MAG TPA: hypothetical protein VEX60_16195 [Pyrinomonadaceae bacterium]|nr:hypothetical protein [Pyrinomonadaceae bacterium]